ncbi:MAG: hypothetical protein AAGU05_01530 [Anaerolineaceae bacterium]
MESQNIDLYYSHLIRTAYLLVDELVNTDLIQMLYTPQKTVSVEVWEKSFWLLLFQMDKIIFEECGIPLFSAGLHGSRYLPEAKYDTQNQIIAPSIVCTARDLGRAFDQVISILFDSMEKNFQDDNQKGLKEKLIDVDLYEISKSIVELILIELCLKRSDIANIY